MMVTGGARNMDTIWTKFADSTNLHYLSYVVSGASNTKYYVIEPGQLKASDVILHQVAGRLGRAYPCKYNEYIQRDVYVVSNVQALYAVGKAAYTNEKLQIDGVVSWAIEVFKSSMLTHTLLRRVHHISTSTTVLIRPGIDIKEMISGR